MAPWAVLASLAVFATIVLATRYVSLGSVVACILFLPASWIFYHPPAAQLLAASVAVALIVFKHRANIDRLRAGTESKLGR